MTGHFFAKTLRQNRGLRLIGFRQQNRKLFSSEPTDDIGIALAFEARDSDRHDTLVPNRMSVAVVDRLEMIDVDHEHRQRPVIPSKSAPFRFCQDQELPPIVETGHAVGGRQLLELLRVADEVAHVAIGQHPAVICRHCAMHPNVAPVRCFRIAYEWARCPHCFNPAGQKCTELFGRHTVIVGVRSAGNDLQVCRVSCCLLFGQAPILPHLPIHELRIKVRIQHQYTIRDIIQRAV
jgi:hypothetical protein